MTCDGKFSEGKVSLNIKKKIQVLSSAWRRTAPTLRMAYAMLNKHGIETPIDVTPDFGVSKILNSGDGSGEY